MNLFISSINIETASIGAGFDPTTELSEFYTTTEENETIDFGGKLIDFLMIIASTTDLYIEAETINGYSQVLLIKAGDTASIEMNDMRQIRVLGALGQEIKYYGFTG